MLTRKKKTGVTLFDLEEGELFAYGYAPNEKYRLIGFDDDNNAIVRAQRAGAENSTSNPYYSDVIRGS